MSHLEAKPGLCEATAGRAGEGVMQAQCTFANGETCASNSKLCACVWKHEEHAKTDRAQGCPGRGWGTTAGEGPAASGPSTRTLLFSRDPGSPQTPWEIGT